MRSSIAPTMSVEVIDNRFVLDPVPPRVGGTGHVFSARDHQRDGTTVALKLYDGAAIDDELRLECYRRERSALQAFTHPHVVRLLAGGHDSARGKHYLALEWLQEDLVTHMRGQGDEAMAWGALSRTVLKPLLQALVDARRDRFENFWRALFRHQLRVFWQKRDKSH